MAGGSQQHPPASETEVGSREEASSALVPGGVHTGGLLVMALCHCM